MLIFPFFFQGADVLAKSLEKQGVRKSLCLLSIFSVRTVMLLQTMLLLQVCFLQSRSWNPPSLIQLFRIFLYAIKVSAGTKRYWAIIYSKLTELMY